MPLAGEGARDRLDGGCEGGGEQQWQPVASLAELRELYPSDSDDEAIAEHSFSLAGLRRLKVLFDAYEDAGGMEIEEFIREVGPLIPHFGREELVVLFSRVDANANGSVDWDEISTYLLLNDVKANTQHTAEMRSREFAARPLEGLSRAEHPVVRHLVHKDELTRLVTHPKLPKYVTGSLDGMVKVWSMDTLRHERTLQVSRSPITDVVCTGWNDLLAVTCMDGTVSFYNCDAGELVRAFAGQRKRSIVDGRGNVLPDDRRVFIPRPKFAVPLNRVDAEALRQSKSASELLGKCETRIPILAHFEKDQQIEATVLENLGFLRRPRRFASLGYPTSIDVMHWQGSEKMFIGLQSGHVQIFDATMPSSFGNPISTPCRETLHIHWDQVSKLKTLPHMDMLLTASYDGTVQVRNIDRIHDVGAVLGEGAIPPPTDFMNIQSEGYFSLFEPLQRGHLRRITSMDWAASFKMIATCAPERDVLLWSPYIQKPITKLEGNRGRVIDVHFNERDSQVTTLTDERVVKIWDLRTYTCVQTLTDTFTDGAHPLVAANYNPKKDCVVLGTSMLRAWPLLRNTEFPAGYCGHRRPVVGVAVSVTYGQLISADSRIVIVWDLKDGGVNMRWDVDEGINDICLDSNERRLLIGTDRGTIMVFNYVNGYLLKTCVPAEGVTEAASAVQFGDQTEPREAKVLASLHESGFVSIYMDDEGGEDAPHRVVDPGGHVYCSVVVPPASIVFGIAGGVSSQNLEEVSDHSTVFERRPTRMVPPVAMFEGPLTPDWAAGAVSATDYDVAVFGDPVTAAAEGLGVGSQAPQFLREQRAVNAITECVLALHGRTSDDPVTIVSATGDGLVHFWDMHTQRETFRFRGSNAPGDGIYCMDKTTDETLLVVGDYGGYIKVFDISAIRAHELNNNGVDRPKRNVPLVILAEMISLRRMWRACTGPLRALRLIPRTTHLVCTSSDCAVTVWNYEAAARVAALGEPSIAGGAAVTQSLLISSDAAAASSSSAQQQKQEEERRLQRRPLPHAQQTLQVLDDIRVVEVAQLLALFEPRGLTWRELLQYYSPPPSSSATTLGIGESSSSATGDAACVSTRRGSRLEFSGAAAWPMEVSILGPGELGDSVHAASAVGPPAHGGHQHPAFRAAPLSTDDGTVTVILQRVIALMVDPPSGRQRAATFDEPTGCYRLAAPLRKICTAQARRAAAALSSIGGAPVASVGSGSGGGSLLFPTKSVDFAPPAAADDRQRSSGDAAELVPDVTVSAPGEASDEHDGCMSSAHEPLSLASTLRGGGSDGSSKKESGNASLAQSTTVSGFGADLVDDGDYGDADDEDDEGRGRGGSSAAEALVEVTRPPLHHTTLKSPRLTSAGAAGTACSAGRGVRLRAAPSQLTGHHSKGASSGTVRASVSALTARGASSPPRLEPSDGEPLLLHNKTPEVGLTVAQLEELDRQQKKREAVGAVMRWRPPTTDRATATQVAQGVKDAIARFENVDATLRFTLYQLRDTWTPPPAEAQDSGAREGRHLVSGTSEEPPCTNGGQPASAAATTTTSPPFTPGPTTEDGVSPKSSRAGGVGGGGERFQASSSSISSLSEASATTSPLPPSSRSFSPTQGSAKQCELPASARRPKGGRRPRSDNTRNGDSNGPSSPLLPSSGFVIPEVEAAFERAAALRDSQAKTAREGHRPQWDATQVLSRNLVERRGGYIVVGDQDAVRQRDERSRNDLLVPRPPRDRCGSRQLQLQLQLTPQSLSHADNRLTAHRLSSFSSRLGLQSSYLVDDGGGRTNNSAALSEAAGSPSRANTDTGRTPLVLHRGLYTPSVPPATPRTGVVTLLDSQDQPWQAEQESAPAALLPPRKDTTDVEALLRSPLRERIPHTRNPPKPIPRWISRVHSEVDLGGDRLVLSKIDQPLHQEVLRKQLELQRAVETEGSWVRELSTMRGIKSEWYLAHKNGEGGPRQHHNRRRSSMHDLVHSAKPPKL